MFNSALEHCDMKSITPDMKSLIERYDRQPVVQALIKLTLAGTDAVVPGLGAVAGIALESTAKKLVSERGRCFFDELVREDFLGSGELLENEAFIHCFSATILRALQTHRHEKIRMFARLLKMPLSGGGVFKDVDDYEYYLEILDDLNHREFQALRILDSFGSRRRRDQPIDLMWTKTIWKDFEQALTEQLGVPQGATGEFMHRLSRTACFLEFSGTTWDYAGGMGKLTPTYRRLMECVQERDRACPLI